MQQDGPATADAARAAFIERVGLIVQTEGLPPIPGRVLGLLLYDGERVSFGQIAAALGVSRGSVSSSVRLLETQRLIRRISEPGDRQDYFQIVEHAWANLLEASAGRARTAAAEIEASLQAIPAAEAGPRGRVAEFAAFYHAMADGLLATAAAVRRRP
jgi:DNA-binding transcriptional regulator GbsR (MarR family)